MQNIPEFNLSLIRHGQSATNAEPDKMGQTSWDPLTDLGKFQAKKLHNYYQKKNHKWDLAFSSHYNRAYDTGIIVTGFDSIETNSALREYDAGKWLGASRHQVITSDVKYKMNCLGQGFSPPDGESLNQVQRRAAAWLDENITYNKYIYEKFIELNRPLEIAVFSHGLTIKCLLQYIMGFDKIFTWKIIIDNTSVSKLGFGKDGWKVYSINDCSHLNNDDIDAIKEIK